MERKLLIALLRDYRFRWRRFDVLADKLQMAHNPAAVEFLLRTVRARRSHSDPNLWGLVSRVGPEPSTSMAELEQELVESIEQIDSADLA